MYQINCVVANIREFAETSEINEANVHLGRCHTGAFEADSIAEIGHPIKFTFIAYTTCLMKGPSYSTFRETNLANEAGMLREIIQERRSKVRYSCTFHTKNCRS